MKNNKLYKYDGTSITQISDINSGSDDGPTNLSAFNGALYFSAYNGSYKTKLYKFE